MGGSGLLQQLIIRLNLLVSIHCQQVPMELKLLGFVYTLKDIGEQLTIIEFRKDEHANYRFPL